MEKIYLYRSKGLDKWISCNKENFDYFNSLPEFETKIVYEDTNRKIAAPETDLKLNEQLCSNYIKDQQKSLDLMVEANGILIDTINQKIKKILRNN